MKSSELEQAATLIEQLLAKLRPTVSVDDPQSWSLYLEAVNTLARITRATTPVTPLLTTKQMAERMNLNPTTLLRRARKGLVAPAAGSKLGTKGASLRWPAS